MAVILGIVVDEMPASKSDIGSKYTELVVNGLNRVASYLSVIHETSVGGVTGGVVETTNY